MRDVQASGETIMQSEEAVYKLFPQKELELNGERNGERNGLGPESPALQTQ